MTKISDLVTEIKKQTLAKNPHYLLICDVVALIKGLEGIDSIPGQMELKEAVVDQVVNIINNYLTNPTTQEQGKQALSRVLSRIWH